MLKYLDKFPTYEELKSLDKSYEYCFNFPYIMGTSHLSFTYNIDLNNKISLDYMEKGYLCYTFIPKKIHINYFYKLNKTNYNTIVDTIDYMYCNILNILNYYNIKER